MVKRYAKKIAPDKDIHPHCLRHSVATVWLKEGKPIRGIQKQLGHKNLVTTQIYMDYFDEDRKKDFSSANNKYLNNLIEEINFLKDEVLKIKSINVWTLKVPFLFLEDLLSLKFQISLFGYYILLHHYCILN